MQGTVIWLRDNYLIKRLVIWVVWGSEWKVTLEFILELFMEKINYFLCRSICSCGQQGAHSTVYLLFQSYTVSFIQFCSVLFYLFTDCKFWFLYCWVDKFFPWFYRMVIIRPAHFLVPFWDMFSRWRLLLLIMILICCILWETSQHC